MPGNSHSGRRRFPGQGHRIERAKALLLERRLSLAEVALAVGFSAQPQFTTAFRRVTGTTPGAWRRTWSA